MKNPELSGLVGVTMWFKPHISQKPETRDTIPDTSFADELRAELLKRGLVSPDRWGKRNATQIAQAVARGN